MTNSDRLVGSTTAAAASGLTRTTFWRAYRAGKLRPRSMTPGGHPRWDLDDLAVQVAALTAPPLPPTPEVAPMDSTNTPTRPSVATAITTSHLGVLVGRRNDGKPPWTFIAGKCHEGEAPGDAAVREVKEETGLIVVAGLHPIGRRIHPKTGADMHYMACLPAEGTDAFNGDTEELAEVRWVLTLRELDELMPDMFDPVHDHLGRMLAG